MGNSFRVNSSRTQNPPQHHGKRSSSGRCFILGIALGAVYLPRSRERRLTLWEGLGLSREKCRPPHHATSPSVGLLSRWWRRAVCLDSSAPSISPGVASNRRLSVQASYSLEGAGDGPTVWGYRTWMYINDSQGPAGATM